MNMSMMKYDDVLNQSPGGRQRRVRRPQTTRIAATRRTCRRSQRLAPPSHQKWDPERFPKPCWTCVGALSEGWF